MFSACDFVPAEPFASASLQGKDSPTPYDLDRESLEAAEEAGFDLPEFPAAGANQSRDCGDRSWIHSIRSARRVLLFQLKSACDLFGQRRIGERKCLKKMFTRSHF
jgi:hypothetical protein